MSKVDKYIGTLLCGAIGDVLGSQSEGMKRLEIIKKFGFVKNLPENKKYTDDTEMTIILASYLCMNNTVNCVELHNKFSSGEIDTRGYSKTTNEILNIFKSGQGAFLPKGKSCHNGSVMRIAPVGLTNWSEIRMSNEIESILYYTHANNIESTFCAFLHSTLINSLVNDKYTSEFEYIKSIINLCSEYVKDTKIWCLANIVSKIYKDENLDITYELLGDINVFQINASSCLFTAICIFFRYFNNPEMAICIAASIGGDTDTIAKIVGDLCGAKHGINWIPLRWRGIESEGLLIELGLALHDKYSGDV